ncbi:MAG TPA: peptidoglycan DD-metalloendopeptidase family protein [Casimicrobiaceae bacterium]|nr:peptidoglycan DD-metalloendopeptidase family protein [Casimicrobiaceae bacterium]
MQVQPATCPVCGGTYDPLRSRAVAVLDGRVRAFCSNACKERGLSGVDSAPSIAESLSQIRQPNAWSRLPREQKALAIAVGVMFVLTATMMLGRDRTSHAAVIATPPVAIAAPAPAPRAPTIDEALDLLGKNASATDIDIWIHPLAGPKRCLPEHDSRRFAAPREGMRPEECGGGHCGVDIDTRKGDIVMAVHDGVVERVQRDPEVGGHRGNEGRFIRINHKGGTIVSSYIHLDGIREDLKPGVPVKVGEPIGTVGDTGVKHSGPHLHFAISVRSSVDGPELFIDPEPLLHLWPVRDHATASLRRMEPSPAPSVKQAQAPAADTSQDL